MIGCVATLLASWQVAPPVDQKLVSFQKDREAALMVTEGWFSVAGLFWLEQGRNTFGTAATNNCVFPLGTVAENAGAITRSGNKTFMSLAPGVFGSVNGEASRGGPLVSDAEYTDTNDMSRVEVGKVIFRIIRRGDRVGIRLFYPDNEVRKNFKGLNWFAYNPLLKIQADYKAYPVPKKLMITNVLGDVNPVDNPGYVSFKIGKIKVRLEAEAAGKGLFFNFKDKTNGVTSYGAGRFLSSEGPIDGKVTLDFNYAVNPPCAYTSFATCPLPPKINSIKAEIAAGEKSFSPK